MAILPLAVGIADRIINAARDDRHFDPTEVAIELVRQHPTANVSQEDIVHTLREEGSFAGLRFEACDPA